MAGSVDDQVWHIHPNPDAEDGTSTIDPGNAGASARREYERRAERERAKKQARIDADREWRQTVTANSPVIGRVQAALRSKPQMTPESQSTRAWAVGAAGEERVAQVLAAAKVVTLHDRKVPASRANIDHIAIGPAGIYVIDAKKYTGLVEARDKGSRLRSDVRLYVKGRDRTKLVEGVKWQCDVVRTLLGDELADIQVRGVLCFIGAEWPGLLGTKNVTVGGVTCTWPKRLGKLVEAPGVLSPEDLDRVVSRSPRNCSRREVRDGRRPNGGRPA